MNIMGDILACRVCLATDLNLYNMNDSSLRIAYENLTGTLMILTDNYPHYLCAYCKHMLVKSNAYKERCLSTLEMFKQTIMEETVLTPQQIQTFSLSHTEPHSLKISPLSYTTIDPTVEPTSNNPIKIEELEYKHQLHEDDPSDSDEEPLSRKVKRRKEKNGEDCTEYKEEKLRYTEFECDSNGKEKDDSDFEFETETLGTEDFEPDEESHDMDVYILSKEEQIQEILDRKQSYNYQNSFYKCELCFKGFITDSTYKNHMTRHDPSSGEHACEICHSRWPEFRSVKAHQASSHEKKYICRLCNYTARSLNRANEHIRYHRGHTYVCKICGATFAKSTSYLTHIRLQHPSKFACELCGESFIGQMGLNMHRKKTNCKETKPRAIFCSECNTKFKNDEALSRHTDSVCDPNLRPCPSCGENFATTDLLREHQKANHESVKCDECDRTFLSQRSFSVHYQRIHVGAKMRYNTPTTGRRRPPVVCEICGKKCMSNATLIGHQRIHSGEKPYQCSECPKRFSVFQRLQIHIRTHTGERPFKCTQCPKAFKHKAALNRHDRVHTGIKPYQCSHCPKSFSQSNSMKLHVRTVHLKLPGPYRNRRNNKNTE